MIEALLALVGQRTERLPLAREVYRTGWERSWMRPGVHQPGYDSLVRLTSCRRLHQDG